MSSAAGPLLSLLLTRLKFRDQIVGDFEDVMQGTVKTLELFLFKQLSTINLEADAAAGSCSALPQSELCLQLASCRWRRWRQQTGQRAHLSVHNLGFSMKARVQR